MDKNKLIIIIVVIVGVIIVAQPKQSSVPTPIPTTESEKGTSTSEGLAVSVDKKTGECLDPSYPYQCDATRCGPSQAWCNNYNNNQDTACHWVGDHVWCCNTEGNYWCDFDVCGSSQEYCDAYNDDRYRQYPIHCMIDDRTDCCVTNPSHIKDYARDKCCLPSQPFMFYWQGDAVASPGTYCRANPIRSDNNGQVADNYLTRTATCTWAEGSMLRVNNEHAYPALQDISCSDTNYNVCTPYGTATSWYAQMVDQGGVQGQCGFITICGNGVLEGTEGCDDGNTVNGDGCSSGCVIEYCGDGIVNNGEECDGTPDCSGECTLFVLYSAFLEDMGNYIGGDFALRTFRDQANLWVES